jgi:hypothetical protein
MVVHVRHVGMLVLQAIVTVRVRVGLARRVVRSMLVLVMGLAPILAPLVGGQLLLYFGWRVIFLALSGFGVLCLMLVYFGLPESLTAERRTRQGFGAVLRGYGALLGDGRYMGYTIAGGLASAAMFAYISGSPFVFIELNGVPPERYGLLFGINAIGLIAASQLNRWLLERYTGLDRDTIARNHGRISASLFLREYRRQKDVSLSRYDGSVSFAPARRGPCRRQTSGLDTTSRRAGALASSSRPGRSAMTPSPIVIVYWREGVLTSMRTGVMRVRCCGPQQGGC